jgi:hypothetical protein
MRDRAIQSRTGCAAAGGKQEAGAVVGAVLGGLLGNSVSGRDRTTGTVLGAAVGAAAGSAVGCEMQKSGGSDLNRNSTYTSGRYRLSSDIQPARFSDMGERVVGKDSYGIKRPSWLGGVAEPMKRHDASVRQTANARTVINVGLERIDAADFRSSRRKKT